MRCPSAFSSSQLPHTTHTREPIPRPRHQWEEGIHVAPHHPTSLPSSLPTPHAPRTRHTRPRPTPPLPPPQAVFDERAFGRSEEELVKNCIEQLNDLFPSSKKLNCTWSSVVKLGQSLYREKPGQDKYRPTQATPIDNFFLCGSYTYQDYLDSMEGATRSGLMVADEIVVRADRIKAKAEQAKAAEAVAA